jgi:hypothetical protein
VQIGETRKERILTSIERTGVCVLLESIKLLDSGMPSVLASMPQCDGKSLKCDDVGPVDVLYFIVAGSAEVVGADNEDEIAISCNNALSPFADQLKQGDVGPVSFIFDRTKEADLEESVPVVFTYRTL